MSSGPWGSLTSSVAGPGPTRHGPPPTVIGERNWQLRHSLWLLWPVLSFGLFTWIGFAYIAGMARRRSWTVYAALYGVGFLVTLILLALVVPPPNETRPGEADTASGLVGLYLLTLWVGGSVHAAVVNRSWLQWRARSGTVPLPGPSPQRRSPSPAPAHTQAEVEAADRQVVTRFTPMVTDAMAARQRFHALLATLPHGPLRSRLEELSPRIDAGVQAVAETVRRAEEIDRIRTALDGERVAADLARARTECAHPDVLAAYEEEVASVRRLSAALEHITNQLRLLNVLLDGAVVRAAEITVTADQVNDPGTRLAAIVDDLDALHASLRQLTPAALSSPPAPPAPSTSAAPASPEASPPPPVTAAAPPVPEP